MQAKVHAINVRFTTLVRAAVTYLPCHDRKTLEHISLKPLMSLALLTNKDSAKAKDKNEEGIQENEIPSDGTAREVGVHMCVCVEA
jgi:hypothetical protein